MSKTVGFAIAETDEPRLDRLVGRFAHGNRSEFLRLAMDRFEALERADQLQRVQRYGIQRSAELGLSEDDIDALVDRALHDHSQ